MAAKGQQLLTTEGSNWGIDGLDQDTLPDFLQRQDIISFSRPVPFKGLPRRNSLHQVESSLAQ